MAVITMDVRQRKRESQQSFALDASTQAALSEVAHKWWPTKPAKHIALAWDLSLDQARSVIAGRASQSTIDRAMKAGGWPLYFEVGARVLGFGADQFLARMREDHEQRAARLGELVSDFRGLAAADPVAGGRMAHPAGRGSDLERRHVASGTD